MSGCPYHPIWALTRGAKPSLHIDGPSYPAHGHPCHLFRIQYPIACAHLTDRHPAFRLRHCRYPSPFMDTLSTLPRLWHLHLLVTDCTNAGALWGHPLPVLWLRLLQAAFPCTFLHPSKRHWDWNAQKGKEKEEKRKKLGSTHLKKLYQLCYLQSLKPLSPHYCTTSKAPHF